MNNYFEISTRLIEATSIRIVRYLYRAIDWNQRLIGILGARGTGKTTLMLQRLKMHYPLTREALYLSLDRLVMLNYSLYAMADQFYKLGGKIHHLTPIGRRDIKTYWINFGIKFLFSSFQLNLHK